MDADHTQQHDDRLREDHNTQSTFVDNSTGLVLPSTSQDEQFCCPICLRTSSDDDEDQLEKKEEASGQKREMVVGPCGHVYCRRCIERHLNAPPPSTAHYWRAARTGSEQREMEWLPSRLAPWAIALDVDEPSTPSWLTTTTTLGVCPMCRAELSLGELRYISPSCAASTSTDAWSSSVSSLATTLQKGDFAFVASSDVEQSPLAGSVYTSSALPTLCFPPHRHRYPIVNNDSENNKNAEHCVLWIWPQEGVNREEERIQVFDQAWYYAPTRTFTGLVRDEHQQRESRLVVSFSHHLNFTTQGVLLIQHIDDNQVESSHHPWQGRFPLDGRWLMRTIHEPEHFPSSSTPYMEIEVANDRLGSGILRVADTGDRVERIPPSGVDSMSSRTIMDSSASETMLSTPFARFDFLRHPSGPVVGEKLIWFRQPAEDEASTDQDDEKEGNSKDLCLQKDHDCMPVEEWTRITQAQRASRGRAVVRLSGAVGSETLIYRRDPSQSVPVQLPVRPVPTYHPTCLWGNTFCQGFKIGLASYHFEPEATTAPDATQESHCVAYISYEHPATGMWPPLDNGMPIPSRVYFHNIHCPTAHTFTGQILWQQDYGTTWQGMSKWDYEMQFDSQFTCIISGVVHSYGHSADLSNVATEMSRYGENLNYCNAALYNIFRSAILSPAASAARDSRSSTTSEATIPADDVVGTTDMTDVDASTGDVEQLSDHMEPPSSNRSAIVESSVVSNEDNLNSESSYYARFRRYSSALARRLALEGASVRTLAMMHYLLTASQQQEDLNPIDFNL